MSAALGHKLRCGLCRLLARICRKRVARQMSISGGEQTVLALPQFLAFNSSIFRATAPGRPRVISSHRILRATPCLNEPLGVQTPRQYNRTMYGLLGRWPTSRPFAGCAQLLKLSFYGVQLSVVSFGDRAVVQLRQ